MSYDCSSKLKKFGDPAINSSKNIAKKKPEADAVYQLFKSLYEIPPNSVPLKPLSVKYFQRFVVFFWFKRVRVYILQFLNVFLQ